MLLYLSIIFGDGCGVTSTDTQNNLNRHWNMKSVTKKQWLKCASETLHFIWQNEHERWLFLFIITVNTFYLLFQNMLWNCMLLYIFTNNTILNCDAIWYYVCAHWILISKCFDISMWDMYFHSQINKLIINKYYCV